MRARAFDRRVAFGEGEEGLVAQATENVGLGESYPRLDLRCVPRMPRPRREHSDA